MRGLKTVFDFGKIFDTITVRLLGVVRMFGPEKKPFEPDQAVRRSVGWNLRREVFVTTYLILSIASEIEAIFLCNEGYLTWQHN